MKSTNKEMSRIGKKPITVPSGVDVKIEGSTVTVKGPKGELKRDLRPEISIEMKDNEIVFSLIKDNKRNRAFWGLTRTLVDNMIIGVTEGYVKKLQLEGVGYRAVPEGQDLVFQVGFSHPVRVTPEDGITFSVEKNIVSVSGIDKHQVTHTAAKIKKIRPPEPYKGKGIRYEGEIIKKKVGKKAAGK